MKGYTRQHYADPPDSAELAPGAAFYANADVGYEQGRVRWPWDEDACKVKDRYQNYVRAAVLLVAAADHELQAPYLRAFWRAVMYGLAAGSVVRGLSQLGKLRGP